MGFYIEELPTELNGITMEEADYLADEFLKDTPCDRMWDAVRALRDFYETVKTFAVEVADRKTEPQEQIVKDLANACADAVTYEDIITGQAEAKGYVQGFKDGLKEKTEPQTERSE